jgi:hypothetical protein
MRAAVAESISEWIQAGRQRDRRLSPCRATNWHLSISSSPALGPPSLLTSGHRGVKCARRKDGHFSPTSPDNKRTWLYMHSLIRHNDALLSWLSRRDSSQLLYLYSWEDWQVERETSTGGLILWDVEDRNGCSERRLIGHWFHRRKIPGKPMCHLPNDKPAVVRNQQHTLFTSFANCESNVVIHIVLTIIDDVQNVYLLLWDMPELI